jgi:branched-chain amino acid transport system substrate-binding protein
MVWIRVPLVAAALAGCKQPTGAAVIGYAFPRESQQAALVAAAELPTDTTHGSIRIVGDWDSGGTEATIELARAHRLVALPRVVGVVGHAASRGTLVTAPIYMEAGIPLVVPTASSSRLWDVGEWIFPMAPGDSVEAVFLANVAFDRLHAQRVAIYFANTPYGAGIRHQLRLDMSARGKSLVDEVPFVVGADLPTLVEASLARSHPDLVILVGRQVEVARIAALIYEKDPGIHLLAADGALDQVASLIETAGPAADSLYLTSFWVPDTTDPLQREFIRQYRLDSGREPLSFEAMRYDAVMILAQAIQEVGPDRAAIRDWLHSLGGQRPAYHGVTGDITFQNGARHHLYLVRLVDGVAVAVSDSARLR